MQTLSTLANVAQTAALPLKGFATEQSMDDAWRDMKDKLTALGSKEGILKELALRYEQCATAVPGRHNSLAQANATFCLLYSIGMTAESIQKLLTYAEVTDSDDTGYNERIVWRSMYRAIDFPGTRSPIAKIGERTVHHLAAKHVEMKHLSSDEYRKLLSTSHTVVLHSVMDDRETAVAFAAARAQEHPNANMVMHEEIGGTEIAIRKVPLMRELVVNRIGLGTTFTRQKLAVHLGKELLQECCRRGTALKMDLR